MSKEFKLPASSIEKVERIIKAHATIDQASTNKEVSKVAGLNKDTISRNNGFLISVGLLEGGNKKKATNLCKNLGHALQYDQEKDTQHYWQEIVTRNDFLSEQITALRVQKEIEVEELPEKILYNAGVKKSQYNKIGANTVVDIFIKSGLIQEKDGAYQVAKGTKTNTSETKQKEKKNIKEDNELDDRNYQDGSVNLTNSKEKSEKDNFEVAINLQLHLPEFNDTSKYDDLFKSLRKNLLEQ